MKTLLGADCCCRRLLYLETSVEGMAIGEGEKMALGGERHHLPPYIHMCVSHDGGWLWENLVSACGFVTRLGWIIVMICARFLPLKIEAGEL